MSRLLADTQNCAPEGQPIVPEHTLRLTSANREPDHARRQLGQWARYREHRIATHQHAAEVQSLLASSRAVAEQQSSSITSHNSQEPINEGRGVDDSDKLQQPLSLVGSPPEDASAREDAAESGDLDPGPVQTGYVPSQRMLRDQGQLFAQESMGPANGHRPSPSVPIHRQQLLQAGIVGVPNSGKSTLTNALVGSKVSCFSSAKLPGRSHTAVLKTGDMLGPKQKEFITFLMRMCESAWAETHNAGVDAGLGCVSENKHHRRSAAGSLHRG